MCKWSEYEKNKLYDVDLHISSSKQQQLIYSFIHFIMIVVLKVIMMLQKNNLLKKIFLFFFSNNSYRHDLTQSRISIRKNKNSCHFHCFTPPPLCTIFSNMRGRYECEFNIDECMVCSLYYVFQKKM